MTATAEGIVGARVPGSRGRGDKGRKWGASQTGFMIRGAETGGRLLDPRAPAGPAGGWPGPLHKHSGEGRMQLRPGGARWGAVLGDEEFSAKARRSDLEAPRAMAHVLECGRPASTHSRNHCAGRFSRNSSARSATS